VLYFTSTVVVVVFPLNRSRNSEVSIATGYGLQISSWRSAELVKHRDIFTFYLRSFIHQ
jgi:hypothetical protein